LDLLFVKTGLLKASDSKVLSVVFVYLVMPCVVLNAFQIKDTPEIRTGLLYSMGIAVGMQHIPSAESEIAAQSAASIKG